MKSDRPIPRDLKDKVKRELEADERLLWMAQPIPRFFTERSTGSFLFAIPWTAFAIFWMCAASGFKFPDFSQGGFSFFPLFGLPFLLIGVGMLSAPWWMYRKAFKTIYAITDRRAMILESGRTTAIRSYPPNRLRNIYRKEKNDGTGDVIFDSLASGGSDAERPALVFGFLNIYDPKTVEHMLRAITERAEGGGRC